MTTLEKNIREGSELLEKLIVFSETIEDAATDLATTLSGKGRLLTCGNGGSAAEAGHLTTELVVRYKKVRPAYAAICLNSHGGDLTAIGNDYGFERVFERQVEAFGRAGDFLVVFSTSGQSRNIQQALEKAHELGIHTLALLGKSGGTCAGKATHEILVPSACTARIQESHLLLLHTLCDLLEKKLGYSE